MGLLSRRGVAEPSDPYPSLRALLWQRDPLAELKSSLPLDAPRRIVDFGCGQGELGDLLHRVWPSAPRIDGFDADPEQVARARQLHSPGMRRFDEADAGALPVKDGAYGLTVAQALLVHTTNPLGVLREMRRVTAGTGRLLVIEPCLRPEVWAENTPSRRPEATALRRSVATALVEGARRTGAGSWDAPARLAPLTREAGWTQVHLAEQIQTLTLQPPYDERADEARAVLLAVWSPDADDAEWATLRLLAEAGGGEIALFLRLRELETAQRAEELSELRRGTYAGEVRRTHMRAVGRPRAVVSGAS